ncbi:hypothetical protein M231_05965 [Tremella mesenterica]|uniref:Uncharacterized protein n=1 Tax=Tremella mesenterica TaxID=5217 RepID=A0A4Q1BGP2_TREME|nr:hypothetical protein M231_05965 [Tremella mesenterica]
MASHMVFRTVPATRTDPTPENTVLAYYTYLQHKRPALRLSTVPDELSVEGERVLAAFEEASLPIMRRRDKTAAERIQLLELAAEKELSSSESRGNNDCTIIIVYNLVEMVKNQIRDEEAVTTEYLKSFPSPTGLPDNLQFALVTSGSRASDDGTMIDIVVTHIPDTNNTHIAWFSDEEKTPKSALHIWENSL